MSARLYESPIGRLTAASAAAWIAAHLAAGRGKLEIELPFFQLANDLAASAPAPPPLTGEAKYDAAIAALVEHRLAEVGIEAPEWVHDPSRVASPEWLVCELPQLEHFVRADTPEPFLRRGVLLSVDDLAGV